MPAPVLSGSSACNYYYSHGSWLREVHDQRRVIAEQRAAATARGAAPDVGRVLQPREQRRVEERLIDPEAVAAVRRVPRVGALVRVEMAERVGPSARPEP